MLEIILGRVAEALYFSIFLILAKRLKTKRIIFMLLMCFEYLLLYQLFPYDVKFQISYTIMTYLILKLLYKEKAQITDIFTFAIASIFLIITSIISFLIFKENMVYVAIANRLIIFISLYIARNKLYYIQNIYKKLWNRNDDIKKKMKSTTFRSLNIVVFNIMFYIINLGMMYAVYYNSM